MKKVIYIINILILIIVFDINMFSSNQPHIENHNRYFYIYNKIQFNSREYLGFDKLITISEERFFSDMDVANYIQILTGEKFCYSGDISKPFKLGDYIIKLTFTTINNVESISVKVEKYRQLEVVDIMKKQVYKRIVNNYNHEEHIVLAKEFRLNNCFKVIK